MTRCMRAALTALTLTLAGCDLGLDKSLIEGDLPPPGDASVQDAALDGEAGKDSSIDADAGKVDGGDAAKQDGADGSADGNSESGSTDGPVDAQCQGLPDYGPCFACAGASCCAQLTACMQDQPCVLLLGAYLDCSSDAGVGCMATFLQSANAVGTALANCVALACAQCQ